MQNGSPSAKIESETIFIANAKPAMSA